MRSHSTTMSADAAGRGSGRHPINVGHLVMGIAFLGLVGIWTLIQTDVVDSEDIRWLLPVPWVLAGGGGLLAIALSSRRRWSARPSYPGPSSPSGQPGTAYDDASPDPFADHSAATTDIHETTDDEELR